MTRQTAALKAALAWHIDAGANECLADEPVSHTKPVNARKSKGSQTDPQAELADKATSANRQISENRSIKTSSAGPAPSQMPLGSSEAREQAVALAQQAETLPALKDAIADFDGLAVRKTAMNLVFADGDPTSRVMIVGEAPGADEDRVGKPFVGASGQLLDRILEAVGLSRNSDDPDNGVYISNILNWRPPGNRTPTKGEIDVSLPFIERHIALAKPDILLMVGGVASKALLNQTASLSKLRGGWHEYKPVTADISSIPAIKARAVYHPAYLLRTPGQKKRVWADMLALRDWLDQNKST